VEKTVFMSCEQEGGICFIYTVSQLSTAVTNTQDKSITKRKAFFGPQFLGFRCMVGREIVLETVWGSTL
jgi:hypothetical protein